MAGCVLSSWAYAWAGPVEVLHGSRDQLLRVDNFAHEAGYVDREHQERTAQEQEGSKGVIETLKGHAQRVIDKIRGRGAAGAPVKSEPVGLDSGVEQGGLKVEGASSGFAKVREHAQRLWNKFTGRSEATFVANKGGDSLQQETQPSEETGKSVELSNVDAQTGQPETATQSLQETKTVQDLQTKYQDGLFAIKNSGSVGDVGNSTTLIESKNISQESVSKGFEDLQKDVKSFNKLQSTLGERVSVDVATKIVQRYADLSFALGIHQYVMPESVDMAKLHEAVMDLSPDGTDALQSVYESRMQMLDKAYKDTQNNVATKIQKNVRARQARQKVEGMRREAAKAEQERQEQIARDLQAAQAEADRIAQEKAKQESEKRIKEQDNAAEFAGQMIAKADVEHEQYQQELANQKTEKLASQYLQASKNRDLLNEQLKDSRTFLLTKQRLKSIPKTN